MSSPLFACFLSSEKIMSCLRERAMFSMPISAAISISSCVDLVFNSVRLIGFSDGTCGSRRLRRFRFRRLRPPPWYSPSSLACAVSPSAATAGSSPSVGDDSSVDEAALRLSFRVRVGLSSLLAASWSSVSGVASAVGSTAGSTMFVSSSCTRLYLWRWESFVTR